MRPKRRRTAEAGIPTLLLALAAVSPLPAVGEEAAPLRLSMAAAVNMALCSSAALRNAAEELRLARLQHSLHRTSVLPRLRIGYDRSRMVERWGPDSSSHRFSLTLSQPIYNGGRNRAARKMAALRFSSARESFRRCREEVIDHVRELYYTRSVLLQKRDLRQRLLDGANRRLELAEKRRNLGLITELELLTVRRRHAAAQLSCFDARQALTENARTFSRVIGCPQQRPFTLTEEVPAGYEGIALRCDVEELMQTALGGNGDLRTARRRAQEAEGRWRSARTAFLPRVAVEGGVVLGGEEFPLHDIGFTLAISISSGGSLLPAEGSAALTKEGREQRSGELSLESSPLEDFAPLSSRREARVRLRQSRRGIGEARSRLKARLESLLEEHRAACRRLRLLRNTARIDRRRFRLVQHKWDMGEVTGDTLNEAQTDLLSTETEILEKVLQLLLLERRLERCLGVTAGSFSALNSRPASAHEEGEQ